jgi:hypothetical protein
VGGEAVDTDIEEAGYAHAEEEEDNNKDSFHYALFCLLLTIMSIRLSAF